MPECATKPRGFRVQRRYSNFEGETASKSPATESVALPDKRVLRLSVKAPLHR